MATGPGISRNPFANPQRSGDQISNPGIQTQEIPNSKQDVKTNQIDDPNNPDLNKEVKRSDPLTDFSGLWENDLEDPKNPKPEKSPVVPQIDPAKLTEMVGKIDFTKNITPEQSTAIIAGGEAGFAAMKEILNGAVRQAFLTSFQTQHKMLSTSLDNARSSFLDEVPSHVKNVMIENSLTSSNAIMKNPAYAPLVEMTRQRFQDKYKKATPAQIETAVNKYFDDMTAESTKAKTEKTGEIDNRGKLAKGSPDADWETWLGEELQLVTPNVQTQTT